MIHIRCSLFVSKKINFGFQSLKKNKRHSSGYTLGAESFLTDNALMLCISC